MHSKAVTCESLTRAAKTTCIPARRFVQIEIPKRVGASLLRAASRMTTPE